MIKEAVILAGGLGTRLKGVIQDIPKPMAPIQNKPFLNYIFSYLKSNGIEKVVLAVGYKYEIIEQYYGNTYQGISINYAIENEPLGTGGAIANALKYTNTKNVFLLNGDTIFNVNLKALGQQHKQNNSQLTLSLKQLSHFNRYGSVELNGNKVVAFNEKMQMEKGYINGGVYALDKGIFNQQTLPQKFSFEKDIMEALVNKTNMQAYISDGYFIDIGIPEDYEKAQIELPNIQF